MITEIVSPFDILASTYDEDFTTSNIGHLQRERVWFYLKKLLAANKGSLKILEINCGTGEDALKLSRLGHTVIATDSSEVMIAKAKEKLVTEINTDIEFVVCPFNELVFSFEDKKFDLIFSNFGGMNCIDKHALYKLNKDLFALLKPGGNIFFVIMSSCCLWEIFYYSLKVRFRKAFRRFKNSIEFTVGETKMAIHYYSPSSLKKIFSGRFSFIQKHPIGLFIPPSYLEKKFLTKLQTLSKLNNLEKRFGFSFFSLFADHYCINFKKSAL